jgi:hypothetical protein
MDLQMTLHIAPRLINRKNSLKSQPTKGRRPTRVMRIVPTQKGQKKEVAKDFLMKPRSFLPIQRAI